MMRALVVVFNWPIDHSFMFILGIFPSKFSTSCIGPTTGFATNHKQLINGWKPLAFSPGTGDDFVSQVFLKRFFQPPAHLFGFPSYWWTLLFGCVSSSYVEVAQMNHYVDDFHHYFRGVQLKNVPGLLLSRCAASAACPYSGSMFENSSEAQHIFGLT